MFDPATMGAALSSLKTIIDLVRNANDAQLAMRVSTEIANIQGKLIDVQQYTLSLQQENQQLHDEIRKMTGAAEDEKRFQFLHGVYWRTYEVLSQREDEEGNRESQLHWEGPFCPLCKDVDGKAVRLKDVGGYQTGSDRAWECEVHNTAYRAPTMQH